MKILAVCGSRRKNGNTSAVLRKTLEPFARRGAEVELIFPGDLNIEGCRGCEGCCATGHCVIDDDMSDIYPKITSADAIIAGSPTYFGNMSSDMKRFIDRCYCFFSFDRSDRSVWTSRLAMDKPRLAGLVSICEQNNDEDMGFTPAAMRSAFESLGFRTVFSQKIMHVFKAGEIGNDKSQLDQAYENGVRLLKTINLHRNLKQNGC